MSYIYRDWIPDILKMTVEVAKGVVAIQNRISYEIKLKLDDSPVTEADLFSHQLIVTELAKLDPSIPVLSEEGEPVSPETRLSWSRYWLIDPLDGTRAFIEGSDQFTINIALIENHIPVLGVVVAPKQNQLYWAVQGEGAYWQEKLEDSQQPLIPKKLSVQKVARVPRQVIVSQFLPIETESWWLALVQRLGAYQLTHCSSSLKICLLARGDFDLYPRMGKIMEWDLAAGQCILEEAGGQLVDLNGKILRYNLHSTLENFGFYAISDPNLISICCG